MSMKKTKENIFWVGVLDKDLRVFDIIMRAEHGTSYNAYIVKGQTKTVLIETAKDKFYDEFLANIQEVCDPATIDYIICNHTEPDHTGSLQRLLRLAPNATVLGSQTAITFLKEIVNEPFAHRAVTEKDSIDIGGMTLQFMSVPMLHWPDTMYTYIPEAKTIFTCDSFGSHYAHDAVFNDEMTDIDFLPAYKYYFDNIIGPFKRPFMCNAVKRVQALNVDIIATGHGPVLRSNIDYYLKLYEDWSNPKPKTEKSVAVVYVSAYGYTKQMATSMESGMRKAGIEDICMFDLVEADMAQAREAIAKADGVLFGSPTILGDALPPIYEALIGLNPIIDKDKFAGVFGSYGWSGEAVKNITERLVQLRMQVPLPGMRVKLRPTQDDLDAAQTFGEDFAKAVQGNLA